MLSRVASSVYWMNRYVERAEHMARFVDVYRHLMLDLPRGTVELWDQLIDATGDSQVFKERFGKATERTVTAFLIFDIENPNSILSSLTAARENARTIRESITTEMWEQINMLYHIVRAAASSDAAVASNEFLKEIRKASHLYAGITDGSLSHDEGWHFGRIGRLQERADKTARMLDATTSGLTFSLAVGDQFADEIQWSAVLKSASGFEMYRRQHGRIEPRIVVGFLLLNNEFPRSIKYCIRVVGESLVAITGPSDGTSRKLSEAMSELDSATRMCEHSDIFFQEVINNGLHETLVSIQANLNLFGDDISNKFFALHSA